MSKLTELVAMPPASAVNGGAAPCPTRLIQARYGLPRMTLGVDCEPVTHPAWRGRMVSKDLGLPYRLGRERIAPYRVTGHRILIAHLEPALAEVGRKHPELRAALGTAGALCVRKVRGAESPSNHCFGTAIDFTIDGVLDGYGDGKVQRGLLDLYGVLKGHGFYWGVEFGREDAMHFELSHAVVKAAMDAGVF